jgi:hypothetical protein
MKRKDMLKIMLRASAIGPSAVDMEKYMSNILTAIENAGMLPPMVRLNATNEFWPIKELISESGYDADAAWEDESE